MNKYVHMDEYEHMDEHEHFINNNVILSHLGIM